MIEPTFKLNDLKMLSIYPGSGAPEDHTGEFERFVDVCRNIITKKPVMIELGCFWAMWTIVFGKIFPEAQLIVLEGNQDKLSVGLANLMSNGLSAKAHFNTINSVNSRSLPEFGDIVTDVTLEDVMRVNKINHVDLLHLDIQGSEIELHREIIDYIYSGIIDNVIIGTHSTEIHDEIMKDINKIKDVVSISAIPYRPGIGDGEIILKRI